jgi:hypothetical protein
MYSVFVLLLLCLLHRCSAVKSDSQPLKADEGASSKRYAEKATAYGVTLLLIWFTFAGIYCMVSMHFKQDTLLYGRSKSD